MAEVFHDYSRYYDLLYKDKDYAGEVTYIDQLIRDFRPGAKTLLNLGCGTGKHDACLQKLGYEGVGVDLSETMLKEASRRSIPGKLDFVLGDVRTLALDRKFDAVISLFHVMSYQTRDEDILAAFQTAHRHLDKGGIFIFDFWHGEGVLKDPPTLRVKRLEDEKIQVTRIAEPLTHAERNIIDVNYHVFVMDKASQGYQELRETHPMRYFFLKEISHFLSQAGFSLKASYEWLSRKELTSAWYGLVIAQK